MKRKVMLLANDSTYVYNLRRELLQALIEEGNTVVVVCEEKQHAQQLREMGCKLLAIRVERHGKNPMKDLNILFTYLAFLNKEKPDVVLTYNIKPNIYGGLACAHKKIPYLVNVCGLGTPLEVPGLLQHLTVRMYRAGVKKARCVFFQNTENEAFFNERHMAPGHHRLIPGSGVSLKQFKLLPYPQGDTTEFLFISRIMKEKGIDQYLEAAACIHNDYPNTVFHVIGGCDDPAYLERLKDMEERGIIVYHGQQPDVRPFQAMSSCTIHPTYYPEGLSNVLLESAASGRPIITTDRSGCREVVEDGVNGFVCRQQDTGDLIRQIEKFLVLSGEQRRDMGLAGRRKVEKEFDRQIVVNAYLDEIGKAVGAVKSGL
ncbi:glycosyltransferase family 4 protein [Allofournierella sp.]|uniref:glycosyltransferase family 4 protein n=1 Tax=Allofournierella sp. TaxID=1940256 RepID=UPI003AB362FE